MRRYPVKSAPTKPVAIDDNAPNVIDAYPVREPSARAGGFTRFHYSSTEISISGGKATVRSHTTRLENGKLTSERFEGETDRATYDRMVDDAQRQFAAQTALMFESFRALLPSWLRVPRRG